MTQPDKIKAAAQKCLKEASTTGAPVNVEMVAAKAGALVTYESYNEELSGVLVKEKHRIVIGVNSFHSKTRQRFTIAHEIGHLVLQHKGEIFVDQTVMKRDGLSSKAVDHQEIEANRFAAELLMPESLVLAVIRERRGKRTSSELVEDLADEFQVSPQAMEYRLTNLGMFIPR